MRAAMLLEQVAPGPDQITALITLCLIVRASYAYTNHVTQAQLHRQRSQRDGTVSLLHDNSRIFNIQDVQKFNVLTAMLQCE